jgi:hypothetical protein
MDRLGRGASRSPQAAGGAYDPPMAGNLQIVFSTPGDSVSDEEFDAWYEEHLDEILSIPGFHSAQRYALQPAVVDAAAPMPWRRLVVYEVDDDTAALMAAMQETNLATADSYEDRKEAGDDGPALPGWWGQVRFASYNCIALGEKVTAA